MSLPFMYVYADFNTPTGYEAYAPNDRSRPTMRATYGVTAYIIRSNQSDKGYYVFRAWPMNSECNHRLSGYAFGVMTQRSHYPDDAIIEILFDHLGHASLAPYAQSVWDRAVEAATKFGAHLR